MYSNKMCGKLSSSSLHEKVAVWLGCIPTRFLIDISAECLAKLIGRYSGFLIDISAECLAKLIGRYSGFLIDISAECLAKRIGRYSGFLIDITLPSYRILIDCLIFFYC
jgi:hypothetical protein